MFKQKTLKQEEKRKENNQNDDDACLLPSFLIKNRCCEDLPEWIFLSICLRMYIIHANLAIHIGSNVDVRQNENCSSETKEEVEDLTKTIIMMMKTTQLSINENKELMKNEKKKNSTSSLLYLCVISVESIDR